MWKKILLICILCVTLTACSSEPETIEGFWISENGETISFNSDGKAISDGMTLDYSIYNENNLSISFWGFASEYKFDIDGDTLYLTDLGNNSTQTFYRDEDKQAEIKQKLDEIAAQQAEQERIEQETQAQVEAEEQAQKEYNKYVNSLKWDLDMVQKDIELYQGMISDTEQLIADYEKDIQEYLQEPDIYDAEFIADYRTSQNEFKRDIVKYRNEIQSLQAEKESIIKELGEY